MAFNNGPAVVTNGLVLALDASDQNSYSVGNGVELVTNPALLNPNDGQTVVVSRTAGSQTTATGLGTMTSGSYYILKYIVTENTGSMSATFRIGGSASNTSPSLIRVSGGVTGSYSTIFQALVTSTLTINGDDVNTYMVFDYVSVQQLSNTWNDLSGNNRNETLINTSFSSTNSGNILFNGNNSSGSYAGNPITGNSAFTLAGWLNVRTHSIYGLAVSIGNATSNNAAYIGYVSTSQSGSSNTIGGGFYGTNFGSGVAVNTGWHYVAFTYAGGANATTTLYVDGVSKVTGNQNPNLSSTAINVGAANTGTAYYYSGSIANVQLYNRALPLSEIQQNYNALKSRFNIT